MCMSALILRFFLRLFTNILSLNFNGFIIHNLGISYYMNLCNFKELLKFLVNIQSYKCQYKQIIKKHQAE